MAAIFIVQSKIQYHSISYNFILHVWQHDKYLNNPVTWLRGPHFLMLWNIHVSCNSSCATCGVITRGIVTRGNGHAHDSHEWNMCRHINIQLTFIIHQQLTFKNMSNSVHTCESCSHMNYQGKWVISACIRNILLMALTIVFCCSVSQLYKYKHSGNKVRSM